MFSRPSLRDFQRDLSTRLANLDGTDSPSKLGLEIGGELWLVDLEEAGEIMPVPALAAVPHTHHWYRGIANVRGRIFSVVDFAAFLGGALTARTETARLVLLGDRHRINTALLVSAVLGLRKGKELQARPASAARWAAAELVDLDGVAWRHLNVAEVVAHPDFLQVSLPRIS